MRKDTMRLTILILLIGQMFGCGNSVSEPTKSGQIDYQPRPFVEFSTLVRDDRVAAVSIRHSKSSLLVRLDEAEAELLTVKNEHREPRMVLELTSIGHSEFTSGPYENFDESLDLFQDGRIVLVRLPEKSGAVAGVFVNLPSKRRMFLFPSVQSRQSVAKIQSLRKRRLDVTVVGPDDIRALQSLTRFPEFQQVAN
jgi:hypothetical protein